MSETQSLQLIPADTTTPADRSTSSIRSQLLWASLFPLAFFGLLATLAISSALNQMMLNLALERNTAQVQVLANSLTQKITAGTGLTTTVLDMELQKLEAVDGSQLYVIDPQSRVVASSDENAVSLPLNVNEVSNLTRALKPASQLMESSANLEETVVSFAALPGDKLRVIFIEPWSAIMSPANYYQLILGGLLALGSALSLGMLSLSIGRVIRPIAALAENAARAVPDSIFHPLTPYGPMEIRRLINAFNQMVIRLAEQQSSLRQYAHKALLSQEEERERLSHELHDGTLQDLLSLSQRVELCRNEMDHDPQLARNRLDELHGLLDKSIDDVRRISNALRPPVLEDLGLSIALDSLCKDLQQNLPALRCKFIVSGMERRLQPDLELAVYRVVQEALANIRKHAKEATLVEVELTFADAEIQATVKNDGAVFIHRDVRSFVRSGHLGLAGMYERTRLFGGTLNITSDADENTTVSLQLPVAQDSFQGE
jgi:signal transduction histidine kinase